MNGRAAERVLERGDIVRVQADDGVDAGRFDQLRNVARDHRIAGLRLAFLTRIGEIRNDSGDAAGAILPERSSEEEEPDELVVGAFSLLAIEALQHISVRAAHALERPALVLVVLEVALLNARERAIELESYRLGERACFAQCAEQRPPASDAWPTETQSAPRRQRPRRPK